MVRLNTFDAGALAQMASRKRTASARRYQMLDGVGNEAQEIGRVIISGDRSGATADQLDAADRIIQWADRQR
jgi:hypothetical protein